MKSWTLKKLDVNHSMISDEHGMLVVPRMVTEPGCDGERNARIIEAAPDMLVALNQLLTEVDDMTARAGWAGNGGRDMARAALAKAGL